MLLWAVRGRVDLRLPAIPGPISLMRPFGKPLPVRAEGMAIDNRHYLLFRDAKPAQAEALLRQTK